MNKKMTTINVSTETKNKVKLIKEKNGFTNYDATIKKLLNRVVFDKNYQIIRRPQVALKLTSGTLNADKTVDYSTLQDVPVYFKTLENANVGDKYTSPKPFGKYYTHESAVVVYNRDDFVLLQLKTKVNSSEGCKYFSELIGVEL